MRFEFTLARDLKRTHAELMSGTSAREMVWWQAFYRDENRRREKQQDK